MSRPDYVYWGTMPTEATPAEIINLVTAYFDDEAEPQLGLYPDTDWTLDLDYCGRVNLTFDQGEVSYAMVGQFSWDTDFDGLLDELEKLATGAWESREGDEDDQDVDVMVWRGPNQQQARVVALEAELADVQRRLDEARAALT